MDTKEALTEGFQRWLEAVVPSQNPSLRFRHLDPFGSSTRSVDALLETMLRAESGDFGNWSDRTRDQKFIDLRAVKLGVSTTASTSLSPIGQAVLDRWRQLGIADPGDGCAVARCVVLALHTSSDDWYVGMTEFWNHLRAIRPPHAWFDDPWSLAAAPYLSNLAVGYNPFEVMRSAGLAPWEQKEHLASWAASMSPPAGWQQSRLSVLMDRIAQFESRPGGRKAYCQALEAIRMSQHDLSALQTALTQWGIQGD